MSEIDAEIARIEDHIATIDKCVALVEHLNTRMLDAEKRLAAIRAIIEEAADA